MTEKIDFKKQLDSYQAKRGQFRVLDVPEMNYLMVHGHGDPNTSPEFPAALEALYPVAYKLKFASKNELGRDYVVPPLEALWWAEDMTTFTTRRDKSPWNWTVMLLVPEWLNHANVTAAMDIVKSKKPPARIDDVRYESLTEGLCVQTLHIGSFDEEGPVLDEMHQQFIPDNRLEMTGRHHEIYFSDFRKTAPEKLRTLLRQPVQKISS